MYGDTNVFINILYRYWPLYFIVFVRFVIFMGRTQFINTNNEYSGRVLFRVLKIMGTSAFFGFYS